MATFRESTTSKRDSDILFVTSNFPRWYGDSTTPFILRLAQDLQELGWRIDVLAPHAPGAAPVEELGGVKVRRFRYFWPESQQTVCYGGGALVNLRKNRMNGLKVPALVAAEWMSLVRHLRSQRYAAVHAHWILPQGFVAALAPRRDVARVLTVHGGDIFGLQSRALSTPKRFALKAADAVTVNSSATDHAVRGLQPDVDPVRIPMGVNERHADPAMVAGIRAEHRRADGPLVVFAGRLVEEKGVGDLLEAMVELQSRCPDATAVVVGEGQDRQAFEARARELGLGASVSFIGWVAPDQVPCYMAAADAFVAPSRRAVDGWIEAQGLVVVEAMMVGTPVVATRLGGIVDAVEDGETGLLVDERAPDQIAKAIELVATDPVRAKEMGMRAERLAEMKFGRMQSANQFSELLDAVITSNRARRDPGWGGQPAPTVNAF